MQAEAGPMGCEPRGFGWSATVEVCSARVTRLVTDQEKSKKFPTRQPVPGVNRCLAPGAWTRFASISTGGRKGAWHRVGGAPGVNRCLAPGAWTRFASISTGGRKGAWHRVGGADLLASGPGRRWCLTGRRWCLAPGAWTRFASIPILGTQRCLAPVGGGWFASI